MTKPAAPSLPAPVPHCQNKSEKKDAVPLVSYRMAPILVMADLTFQRKPQSLVTFIVGSEDKQQTFVIHKDFATFYSPKLETAFNAKNERRKERPKP